MTHPDTQRSLLDLVAAHQNADRFKTLLWEGSYAEYLDIVQRDPAVARTAWQRLYDLVEHFGSDTYTEYKKPIERHRFFDDPFGDGGRDARHPVEHAVPARRQGCVERVVGPDAHRAGDATEVWHRGVGHIARLLLEHGQGGADVLGVGRDVLRVEGHLGFLEKGGFGVGLECGMGWGRK